MKRRYLRSAISQQANARRKTHTAADNNTRCGHRPSFACTSGDLQGGVRKLEMRKEKDRLRLAVKEAALLLAVQSVVGGVKIDDYLCGRLVVRFEEEIEQKRFNLLRVVDYLLVARGGRSGSRRQLQTIERAPRCKRTQDVALTLAAYPRRITLARGSRKERVARQIIVIIQILIAERNGKDPLSNKVAHRMLNQTGIPVIGEAVGKTVKKADALIGPAKQEDAGIGRDGSSGKISGDIPAAGGLKNDPIRDTLCHIKNPPSLCHIALIRKTL